ncbi:MAG: M20/M25/M40 family metallo-hydrolase [Saprospiraceae bacterium]
MNANHYLQARLLLSLICLPILLIGQNDQVNRWLDSHIAGIIQSHRDFVSLPNDANYPEDMQVNVLWLEKAFQQRGFQTKTLEAGDIPIFFAEKKVDSAKPTVLFYLHYDGQPVDPSKWDQGHPFKPVLKKQTEAGHWETLDWALTAKAFDPEWRMFARAAADDKGPITMFLSAFDYVNESKLSLAFNVKVLVDGEEEKGSKGLLSTLETYAPIYAADRLIIMDGPAHPSNRPTLTFGCRGVASASLTVYGPQLAQHSGHFGNYAPNPVFRMAHLLASMKDEEGKVLIDGFYDGIELDEKTLALLAAVPDDATEINARLGVAAPEKVGRSYQEALQYPSLNIKGMASGWVGKQTRTIIPDVATAQVGIRLVPESDGDRLLELVRLHIQGQGYFVIDREPTEEERLTHPKIATFSGKKSVNAFRTEIDSPTGQWLTGALRKMFRADPVNIRIMGGTVPVTPLIETLGVPAVIVPMVNMDNNQHSPNENLRLGNLLTGIKTCLAILTQPF